MPFIKVILCKALASPEKRHQRPLENLFEECGSFFVSRRFHGVVSYEKQQVAGLGDAGAGDGDAGLGIGRAGNLGKL